MTTSLPVKGIQSIHKIGAGCKHWVLLTNGQEIVPTNFDEATSGLLDIARPLTLLAEDSPIAPGFEPFATREHLEKASFRKHFRKSVIY